MSRRVEFSSLDWACRPAPEKIRPLHVNPRQCALDSCGVFVCRAPGRRFACGRYVGACQGGDDNRCADCACKAWRDLKRRIVAFVKTAKTSRGEIAICQRFGRSDEHAPTEDALHELVQEKKLFWFGSQEKPLRYVAYNRRGWAKRVARHAQKLEIEKEERAQDRRFARERRSSEAA